MDGKADMNRVLFQCTPGSWEEPWAVALHNAQKYQWWPVFFDIGCSRQ